MNIKTRRKTNTNKQTHKTRQIMKNKTEKKETSRNKLKQQRPTYPKQH